LINSRNAILLSLILLMISPLLYAQDEAAPAPPPTEQYPADEQPEVTITQRGTDVIEEYRIHGRLYMIKVTPKKGIPYYLIDTNGDGTLDTRRSEVAEKLLIPGWILLRW